MNKLYISLLFAFLAVQVKSKNPRDIVDEANALFEELDSTIKGTIMEAHDDLSNVEDDFLTNSDNVMINGEILIQQEGESIEEQLSTVKELANGASVDVSDCTNVREDILISYPNQFIEQLRSCVIRFNLIEVDLVAGGKYIVDVSYNKVANLKFQFDRCGEDLLCLSPLITEMELYQVSLPQDIKSEVNRLTKLLSDIQISVGDCSGRYVSAYVGNAEAVLSDITACVSELLD